jgi:hypothetical protein
MAFLKAACACQIGLKRVGFGRLYNVARPLKQAGPANSSAGSGLGRPQAIWETDLRYLEGFASPGGSAYLVTSNEWVRSHERSGTA